MNTAHRRPAHLAVRSSPALDTGCLRMDSIDPPLPRVETADALFTQVYDRLKTMANRQRGRGPAVSISTTEVVHELFLRMSGESGPRFSHPLEFFSYAARAMRHLLLDLARNRSTQKGGGDLVRVALTDPLVGAVAVDPGKAIELDSALNALEADAPRALRVLELHYFAGLPLERVAEITGMSERTVDRDWRYARSFLALRMQ